MSFRLVIKQVTLNNLERLLTFILRYSTEFGSFGGQLRTVIGDRPIRSATKT